MNEIALKKLYWELKDRVDSYAKKLATLKGDARTDYEELKDLIKKLEQRAVTASISLDSDEGVGQVADETNDWMQILELSSMPAFIQDKIKNKVKNSTPQYPTGAEMQVLIDNIMKFYNQNTKLKDDDQVYIKILDHVNPERSGLKNYTPAEMASVKADFNEYIIAAIDDGIKGLDSNSWSWQMEDVHHAFEEYYMQRKQVAAVIVDHIGEIPHQYKINLDIGEFGKAYSVGKWLKLTAPSAKISIQFSFSKKAHLARINNEDIIGPHIDGYTQIMRNTISLGSINKGLNFKPSTNLYSHGMMIHCPDIPATFVVKKDLGTISWADIMTKGSAGVNLGSVVLKADIDLLKINLFNDLNKILEKKGISITAGSMSFSLGYSVLVAPIEVSDIIKKSKIKTVKVNKHISESFQMDPDDVERYNKLKKDAKKLEQEAQKIRDIYDKLENGKPDKQGKKIAKEFVDKADKLFEEAKDKAWKSKAGKEFAEEVLEETSKKIFSILGKKTLTTMAKVGMKAIPFIGAAMTAIEMGVILYNFFSWLNEGEKSWEVKIHNVLTEWYNADGESRFKKK